MKVSLQAKLQYIYSNTITKSCVSIHYQPQVNVGQFNCKNINISFSPDEMQLFIQCRLTEKEVKFTGQYSFMPSRITL